MHNLSYGRILFWVTLSLFFLFIGYEVLHADYLFTDEAFMLWHQPDQHTIATVFHSIGRALTGWLLQHLFGIFNTVAAVKYIRLLSLALCMIAVLVFYLVLKRLQRRDFPMSDLLIYAATAFMAASLSSMICIGWAVCPEVFISTILSLIGGTILFESIQKEGYRYKVSGSAVLAVILLGVGALFFYQSTYTFLLLPFYLQFLLKKDGKADRTVFIGLAIFLFTILVYYLLFKYSLRASGIGASNRTSLAFDPLERLSFFFSYPLNQAFNLNAFFDVRSIVSQAVFPVLFTAWVIGVFYSRRGQTVVNLRFICGIFGWLMLAYLPALMARESFGPYRTMSVLSMMVFLLLADWWPAWVKPGGMRTGLYIAAILVLLARGGYVYKYYLADPLHGEYKVIRKAVSDQYTDRVREVVFVLPKENGFNHTPGIRNYKDEFGVPSSSKDWTPEPLTKQIVYELTGNRQLAEALKVTLMNGPQEIRDTTMMHNKNILFINAPSLLESIR